MYSSPKRILASSCALALAAAIVGCSGSSSSSTTTGKKFTSSQFLFIADNGGSQLSSFSINQTSGALTAVSGSPFTADAGPVDVAANPSKDLVYVANQQAVSITTWSYDGNGKLTSVAAHALASAPRQVLVNPAGTAAYVLVPGGLVSFAIDPSSSDLTAGNTLTFAGGAMPSRMAMDGAGDTIYAVDPAGMLSTVSIAGTAMTEASASPMVLTTDKPIDIACCSSVNSVSSLYIVDFTNATLVQYLVNGNASYTRAGVRTTAATPNRVALDKNAVTLFVTSQTADTIAMYGVNSTTGAADLQIVSQPTGTQPTCLIHDNSGLFWYVPNFASNSVTSFVESPTTLNAGQVGGTTGVGPRCGTAAMAH